MATLRFQTVDGAPVIAKTKDFASAKVGDVLAVTYDPQKPMRVRAASASSDYVGAVLFALGGAGMLIAALMVAVARPPKWLWTERGA